MVVFPSKEWIEEVIKTAEESERYKEKAEGWEGDFLNLIEIDDEFLNDISSKKGMKGFLSFLDMLSAEERKKYEGTPLGNLLENKLDIALDASPEEVDVQKAVDRVSELSKDDVEDAVLYFWTDFWHGTIRDMDLVPPDEHKDARFKLSGEYKYWKMLVSAEEETMSLIQTDRLILEGDMSYMLKNIQETRVLTSEVFASVPIED